MLWVCRLVLVFASVSVLGGGESPESGRQVLYSFLQSSMSIRASIRDPNLVMFNSSSRTRPLNDSTQGFSQGEPGSM